MKMICEVPDEVIKCIKDGTWCGSSVAEKMIANGIPLSSSEEPCEDAISRQAAIDAIYARYIGGKEAVDKAPTSDHYAEGIDEAVCAVEDLPSVTPQQKTGHWIETAEEYYKAINEKGGGVNENTPYFTDDIACSECLAKFSMIDNETERFKCCPNCGAKMEEVEE